MNKLRQTSSLEVKQLCSLNGAIQRHSDIVPDEITGHSLLVLTFDDDNPSMERLLVYVFSLTKLNLSE